MRAGPLRNRCRIQASMRQQGKGGSVIESWSDVGAVWADVTLPTGRIQAVSDQLQAVITAEIQTRFRSTIKAGMRIVHGPTAYLIEAALPDSKRTMLRLLCSNVVNP